MKPAALITAVFLILIAVLHLFRLLFSVEVLVEGTAVPMWASVFGVLGPAALAVWLWREQRRTAVPPTH